MPKCFKIKPTMKSTGFQSQSWTSRASGASQTIPKWCCRISFKIRGPGEVTIYNIQMMITFNKIIIYFKTRTIRCSSLNTNQLLNNQFLLEFCLVTRFRGLTMLKTWIPIFTTPRIYRLWMLNRVRLWTNLMEGTHTSKICNRILIFWTV